MIVAEIRAKLIDIPNNAEVKVRVLYDIDEDIEDWKGEIDGMYYNEKANMLYLDVYGKDEKGK